MPSFYGFSPVFLTLSKLYFFSKSFAFLSHDSFLSDSDVNNKLLESLQNMWPIVLRTLILGTLTCYMIIYTYYAGKNDRVPSLALRNESLDKKLTHWPAVLHAILSNLSSLDCVQLAQDTSNSDQQQQQRRSPRITLAADPANDAELSMDCAAVLGRWDFQQHRMASSQAEADFPIAFARTDYLLLEQLLSVEYVPHNLYCYTLDAKATPLFKRRIRTLASCLSLNVFVSEREFNVQSNGQNVSSAHLACLEKLWRDGGRRWKYAFLLQNHDIPLRTNAELIQILRLYGGANEIGTTQITQGSVNQKLDWTFSNLHLYKNGSSTDQQQLNHTKSTNLVALSRPAVEFLLQNLSLNTYIKRLELSWYGMDEVFLSTLNSNLADFPGGFTRLCLEEFGRGVNGLGRLVIWANSSRFFEIDGLWDERCRTRYRHGVCIFGTEHLGLLSANPGHHFYANKMMPEFDYACIHCWLRILSLRRGDSNAPTALRLRDKHNSHLPSPAGGKGVNATFFLNLPHVQYNRLMAEGRLDEFRC